MRNVTLPAAIIARFRSLSLERLERIEAGWTALFQGEGDRDQAVNVRQELHTLQGDSRVVGFNDVQLLARKLEELVAVAEQRKYQIPEEFDLVVTMAIRLMVMLLRTRDGASLGGIDVNGFVLQIDEMLADHSLQRATGLGQALPSSRRKEITLDSLDRVSSATQQRLAVAATEVFLEQLRGEGLVQARLLNVWRSLSRQISVFYAVPLAPRVERHQDAAGRFANDLGKEIIIDIKAAEVHVRTDAANALDTALVHLMRNAIDHGVEDPETRVQAGKPRAGRVCIEVYSVDDFVEVQVKDDGKGIDTNEVREKAVTLGLLSKREAERASEAEALELLLEPGFSTRLHIGDVFGKSSGLDAVRGALAQVGGKLALSTRQGHGTVAAARVPQASRMIEVKAFAASGRDLMLAVPVMYSVEAISAEEVGDHVPLNPLAVLTLNPLQQETVELLNIMRNNFAMVMVAGGPVSIRTAERFCPTGDDHAIEVVVIDEAEALLLRPERLLKRKEVFAIGAGRRGGS